MEDATAGRSDHIAGPESDPGRGIMLAALTSSEMQSIALGYAMLLVVPGPSLLIVV